MIVSVYVQGPPHCPHYMQRTKSLVGAWEQGYLMHCICCVIY